MRELLTRTFTGIVYVSLLILCIWHSKESFLLLFFLFGFVALFEFQKMVQTILYLPFSFFIAGSILIYSYPLPFKIIFLLLIGCLILNSILIYKLFNSKKNIFNHLQAQLIGSGYVSGGFLFLMLIPLIPKKYEGGIILSILILIWINDTFAYLVGKKWGNTKLFPSISPKKTIEGACGGLIFTGIGALLLSHYFKYFTSLQWVFMGLIVVVFGTIGDLVESKFKRTANVKDSGRILPGHGGILDRLDSILFAAPFIYAVLILYTS